MIKLHVILAFVDTLAARLPEIVPGDAVATRDNYRAVAAVIIFMPIMLSLIALAFGLSS